MRMDSILSAVYTDVRESHKLRQCPQTRFGRRPLTNPYSTVAQHSSSAWALSVGPQSGAFRCHYLQSRVGFNQWCAACYKDVRRLCIQLAPSYRGDTKKSLVLFITATWRRLDLQHHTAPCKTRRQLIITEVSKVSLILNVVLNSCALLFVAHHH